MAYLFPRAPQGTNFISCYCYCYSKGISKFRCQSLHFSRTVLRMTWLLPVVVIVMRLMTVSDGNKQAVLSISNGFLFSHLHFHSKASLLCISPLLFVFQCVYAYLIRFELQLFLRLFSTPLPRKCFPSKYPILPQSPHCLPIIRIAIPLSEAHPIEKYGIRLRCLE